MVKTLTKARINQGDVVLLNPNAGLNKLFEITKMQEVFSIVDSIAAAENYFKN
jgi:anti-anti-sigma regulatory factor